VSTSASFSKKVFESAFVSVELSLRTSRAAEMGASGPDVSASKASCGTYVKKNMADVMLRPRVTVGPILDVSGFQRLRCAMK
jgi:hypothetical protein